MPEVPFLTATKWVALGLIAAVIAALIFLAGAGFGSRRNAMFMRGPGGERGFSAFGVALPHMFIMHGHGAVGQISAVSTSSLEVIGPDGVNERVDVTASTTIESSSGPASLASLAPGMRVVILGEPSADASITAKLIRVLPEPTQQ